MSVNNQRLYLKTEVSEQLCRLSRNGAKDTASLEAIAPLADEHGHLWVRTIEPIISVDGGQRQKSSPPGGVLVQSDAISPFGLPTRIINVSGYNANAGQLFVMLFDSIVIASGDVPAITIPVPGNYTSFSYGAPFVMLNGLGIAISSTEFAYTPVAPASLSYVATFYMPIP